MAIGMLVVALASCGGGAREVRVEAREARSVCAREVQPGSAALVRLTRDEYDATLRDLLGADVFADAELRPLPRDEGGLGFAVGATVSPLVAEIYHRNAEEVAARAARSSAWLPCDPSSSPRGEACARDFVVSFGRRAYRRHLSASQIDRVMAVYRAGASAESPANGVRLAITAMLQSPHFLYRVELGDAREGDGASAPLAADERATRLAYFLWGTMPDAELFAAADAGELATAEGVAAQARRMLEDPRAAIALERFAVEWLELELSDAVKDEARYPEWSAGLAESADASTRRFVTHVVFESTGTIAELLTAPYAFVDAELAPLYGVAAPADAGMTRVALDPTRRAGLLSQVGVLAQHARNDQSSPVMRGRWVRERLLCQHLPPPPDDVSTMAPAIDGATTRARYEQHGRDVACVGCHELMDPIGFALEHYDAIGRYRERDGEAPIDARGAIVGSRGSDGEVDGAVALARHLAGREETASCFASQMWTYAMRREPSDDDACSLEEVRGRLAASGGDVRELMIAIAQSDAFLHRPARAPRGAP